jgi:lysophospholipase L1-like esterase
MDHVFRSGECAAGADSPMIRTDLRSEPVRRLVVMGESNAYGMCATRPECEWVQVVARLIREHQDGPVQVLNNAIPSNVISPGAPFYDPTDEFAQRPTALDRYRADMIERQPDLAVFAYGLNDAAQGHAASGFLTAYEQLVRDTRSSCPQALILLVGPYWGLAHDPEAFASRIAEYEAIDRYDVEWLRRYAAQFGGPELVSSYRSGIARLADAYGAIFVDLYPSLEGATWLLHGDTVHFNDVGQTLIGLTVFAAIASRCSFVAAQSRRAERELDSAVWTTGGTQSMTGAYGFWRRT